MNPPQPIVASGRPWPSLLRSCLDQFGAEAAGANLGIVFLADPATEAADEILKALRTETGVSNWIGAAGGGIIAGGREIGGEGGIAIATLRLPRGAIRLFDLSRPTMPPGEGGLAIVHAPTDEALSADALVDLGRSTGAFLVGGRGSSAFEAGQFVGTPGAGGLVGATLRAPVACRAGLCRAHEPVGPERQVTAALGGRLLRLDGRPALDVLREAAGELLVRDPARLLRQICLAPLEDGDRVGRLHALLGHDAANGGLRIDAPQLRGSVRFMRRSPGYAIDALRDQANALKRRLDRRAQLALLYVSERRGPELLGPGVGEAAVLQAALGDVPLIGLRTREEIFDARPQSHAAVLCLIG
ncbi:MAG: hypothetical protein KDG89_16305 [Geminicoccaceae bacterium]|nr:hypothetical protein [Geminicoccaceae bacterium]